MEAITFKELLSLIGNVGFPIVVASYLLIRTNGKMDRLKDAIHELSESIKVLKEELRREHV